MKRITSYFTIFIFCIVLLNGCKKTDDQNLSVYKNFYDSDVSTFNYIISNNHSDYTHIANFVDGLVENDKYGNIVPSIAKAWKEEIIDNKQVWTFYLRDDAYWSDYKGNKYAIVTAHDFVNTLKYTLNYNIESDNYNLPVYLIENALSYYNATLIRNYNYEDIKDKINNLNKSNSLQDTTSYNKILTAFNYCASNDCSLDFDTVGVKAINDFELQFTLSQPSSYFLTTLTYCSFLPSNEEFIKEIGFNNFGTNQKYLLYNGAYILNDYHHSSKIEYIKNKNYWDKDKVYIDKIIFNKLLNYPSTNYTRLSYEAGNVDEFYVNSKDEVGWNKYVLGEDNSGTITSPSGNNTYSINETTDFTTYYIIFNQNRTNSSYSSLNEQEIINSNLALSNTNFRKALLHGLHQGTYTQSYLNEISSSIVPENFISTSNKDYHTYFLEEYATNNNISVDEVSIKENQNTLVFNSEKSQYYLNLALKELTDNGIELPIKLEFSYYYSQEYKNYDLLRIKEWNNILNGCDHSSSTCSYDKVLITFNDSLSTYNDFNYAIENGEYSISLIGLYPNFIDPTAYLQAFSDTGEIFSYINHGEAQTINDLLSQIKLYYKEEDLETRFKLCAKLEYKIIYDLALVLPFCIRDTTNKILVTNLEPYQKMKASYGLSPFKFKLRKLAKKQYSQDEITKLKQAYDRGEQ